jgi:hypothetical protein
MLSRGEVKAWTHLHPALLPTLGTVSVPDDTAEIEEAARSGQLEETASFDAKAELPSSPRKNADRAIDVGR